MDFLDLNKMMKKEELGGAYLFKGGENYLMEKYISRIRDQYIAEDFRMINYIELENQASFDQILNACETLPFLSQKKLIVVKDIVAVLQNDKTIGDKLNDYLGDLSQDNILILRDKTDKLNKNTRLYKSMKKDARLVEFNSLNKAQLDSFIRNFLGQASREIEPVDLAYLIDRIGYLNYRSEKTLYEVENELLKIIGGSQPGQIDKSHIDKTIVVDPDVNIFQLIDLLMESNSQGALLSFNNLYSMGEPISRIIYMLIRHYRLLAKYISYSGAGYGQGDINQKLKISPFELRKLAGLARKISRDQVEASLKSLLDFDIRQKSLAFDEKLAMEILLVDLSRRR